MSKSNFIKNKQISAVERKFEKWLLRLGYTVVSDFYPAVVHATTLIPEFLEEYPDLSDQETTLFNHANSIGLVSDYSDDITDEEDFHDSDDRWV